MIVNHFILSFSGLFVVLTSDLCYLKQLGGKSMNLTQFFCSCAAVEAVYVEQSQEIQHHFDSEANSGQSLICNMISPSEKKLFSKIDHCLCGSLDPPLVDSSMIHTS